MNESDAVMNQQIHQAITLIQQQRISEAEAALQRLNALTPGQATVLSLYGLTQSLLGKPIDAIETYHQALEKDPFNVQVLINLGGDLIKIKNFPESLKYLLIAKSIDPHNPLVHLNIGNVQMALGSTDNAIASFNLAIKIAPNYADAWSNIGECQLSMGDTTNAIKSLEKALSINPSLPEALNNLGLALTEKFLYQNAIGSFKKAIKLNPKFTIAYNNMGICFQNIGLTNEAARCFKNAITSDPELSPPYFNFANLTADAGKIPEAIKLYKTAHLKGYPSYEALASMLYFQTKICDWNHFEELSSKVLSAAENKSLLATPLYLISIAGKGIQQLNCGKTFSERSYGKIPRQSQFSRLPSSKIRIGYLSANFRKHAVSYLCAGLFESHDKSRFETFAFDIGPTKQDEMTARLKKAFDHFISINNSDNQSIAEYIRLQKIDILIDLMGFTTHARPEILAHGAAPLQVNFIGFPATTGSSFIDYIIADPVIVPKQGTHLYSEKIVFLPECFQPNDQNRKFDPPMPRESYGLNKDALILGCFNQSTKISPSYFSTWCQILQVLEHAQLWLIEESTDQRLNLMSFALSQGIKQHQLVFGKKLPYEAHLARYAVIDIVLDTAPFSGGTTTSDALWVGAPVVTVAGETFASRMTASLLTSLGLNTLITSSIDDYKSLILRLGKDPIELQKLKDTLIKNHAGSPLFNTIRYTRHFEKGMEMVMDRYRSGLLPENINVPMCGSSLP